MTIKLQGYTNINIQVYKGRLELLMIQTAQYVVTVVEVEVEISELSQLVKQIIVDLLGCKTLKHVVRYRA